MQTLRFYIPTPEPTTLQVLLEDLVSLFGNALSELAEMSQRVVSGEEPIFNIVPVIGAGRSASSMDDIVTCELLARKS